MSKKTRAAFEVLNPAGRAPVLLLCDHASNRLPARSGTLGLAPVHLQDHIAWDIGAADVTRRLAALLDAPAVLSGYSRLFIDCNRRLDQPESIPAESDGIAVPGNRSVDAAEAARRAALAFHPYHEAIARQIEAMAHQDRPLTVIAVHSCTPVYQGVARPWHVGVLWDKDEATARALMTRLRRDPELVVGENEPYSAQVHPGYTVACHTDPAGLSHSILEIRQDLVDDDPRAHAWSQRLAEAYREILALEGVAAISSF
jgi:predicted N-formylglutamate amidohydrolase